MKNRYDRNFNLVTPEEFAAIRDKRIAIIGLGGLGGNVLEMLSRFGFRNLLAIDSDVFEDSNLNRQILSTEAAIGRSKAQVAQERVHAVNSEVRLEAHHARFDTQWGMAHLKDVDLVIDALDNIPSRKQLAAVCETYGIPMVHGAIDGWFGQVAVVEPGSKLIEKLYRQDNPTPSGLGNPPFTAALIASMEVGETVKYLAKKGIYLSNQLLIIDILEHMYEIIEI